MSPSLVVVTPVFNDWASFAMLEQDLAALATSQDMRLRIVAVDDGSSAAAEAVRPAAAGLTGVEVVRLVCNLGHQRAIAIGLVEASKSENVDAILVMDCDGEDRVADIPRLLATAKEHPGSLVVATRLSRTEGFGFRALYMFYKLLFRMLVGSRIDFGNFTLIPAPMIGTIVHSSGLWNHLAATISRSRLPLVRLPCARGTRYAGRSKMNFHSLLLHGLGAMSVYVDVVLARIISYISLFVIVVVLAIAGVLIVRFATGLAIPGWATTVTGVLIILLLQSFIFVFTSVFMLLNMRSMSSVIPVKDAPQFIESRKQFRMVHR